MQRNLAVAQQTAPSPSTKSSFLARVKRGPQQVAPRVVLYGPEGVGKSTFAANAPGALFLGAEEGTAQLDVARLPEPKTWQDVLDSIDELTRETHDFQSLVIDTLDWIEPLCFAEVCRKAKCESIEDPGFGKGYTMALDYWRGLLARLDALRVARGMNIICLAHTQIRTFKNPAGDDFDRYELKVNAKAAGLWKEWADAVLFAVHEEYTKKGGGPGGKAKAFSTGARVVHTQRQAAWDAKSRYPLPEMIALDWHEFWGAVQRGEPDSPEKLTAAIAGLLDLVDPELRAKVEEAVTRAKGDAVELARILNKLAVVANKESNQ